MSVEEVGAIWGTISKVGAWEAKKLYHGAQNVGMRYQNWRHKGAGEGAAAGEADDKWSHKMDADYAKSPATTRGSGKNWTTDEESFENTTTSHTTYTRKKTR